MALNKLHIASSMALIPRPNHRQIKQIIDTLNPDKSQFTGLSPAGTPIMEARHLLVFTYQLCMMLALNFWQHLGKPPLFRGFWPTSLPFCV
ncbi:MAG: hypothetical protein ACJA1U_002127 [Bermanella sp.]|jgi:hypothetical protein